MKKKKTFRPNALCFIKECQTYREITCGELNQMQLENPKAFENRWFIPVEGILLEVSRKDYKAYYQMNERWNYLGKLDQKYHPVSLEQLSAGVKAQDVDVYRAFENAEQIKVLRKALTKLDAGEKALIESLFFEEQSIADLSKQYQVSEQTIYSKKRRILEKLRQLIEA